MIIHNLNDSVPFITRDGSQIRSILDRSNSPAMNQSIAEATLEPGSATAGHRHPRTEEIYFVLSGRGQMTVGGESRDIGPLDAVLIPPGAFHQLVNTGRERLVFLCCCAPPYSDEDTAMEEEGNS